MDWDRLWDKGMRRFGVKECRVVVDEVMVLEERFRDRKVVLLEVVVWRLNGVRNDVVVNDFWLVKS